MQIDRLQRRDFLALLGGASLASPLAARAQQPAVPTIGVMTLRSATQAEAFLGAFRDGLREAGFVEDRTVKIDYRFGDGRQERLAEFVAEFVRRRVAVLVAGSRGEQAAKSATATIPVVFFTGGDPIQMGLVASLNRPGGNLTGFTMLAPELMTKRVGLLNELVPRVTDMGILLDPTSDFAETTLQEVRTAGQRIGVAIHVVNAASEGEYEGAFASSRRGLARSWLPRRIFSTSIARD